MFTIVVIGLILGYIGWELHFSPVKDENFTRRTIIRCRLMQQDLKHGRRIRKYNNLV